MRIKGADDRQPHLIALERLLDRPDVPSGTWKRIEVEIRNIRAGEKGERDAAYQIDFWYERSPNWAVIHDLRLEVGGLVAQLDHVIVNRLAQVWICESKSFAEGVSVNEHGEWVRWWHGRSEGIPSPIEQNRRHIELLRRAFDDRLIPAPRRLGVIRWKPQIRSLVLVSDNARIGRPRRSIEGIDQVIKVERLQATLDKAFDAAGDRSLLGIIGKEGLEQFARALAAVHQPAAIDCEARFGLPSDPMAPSQTRPALRDTFAGARSVERPGRGVCARCGRDVSAAVVTYCGEHADEFGDAIFCMRCQPEVRARHERPLAAPPWAEVLARYRTPTRLRTVARQAPFIVQSAGNDLIVTPESSDRARPLRRDDFERAAPLLDREGRAEVNEASRNSSYVQAILADLRRA